MTVRHGLIHYSANQLGRRHDRNVGMDREEGGREGVSGKKKVTKTKHLIGFCFIGRTHRDHLPNISRKQQETVLFSLFFFLYIYVYVDECKYTGCFSFQVWKFIGSFCGWV